MPYDRDIGSFDARAAGYEAGWKGRLHHDIADRVVELALDLDLDRRPRRVLDVGCGTGYLLRRLTAELPDAEALTGVDPAPRMVDVAASRGSDPRLMVVAGTAEGLTLPDASVDLALATTSFDHWADQAAGVRQVARILAPGGHFVLADLLSVWMLPTLALGRRGRVRTARSAAALLEANGLDVVRTTSIHVVITVMCARKRDGDATTRPR